MTRPADERQRETLRVAGAAHHVDVAPRPEPEEPFESFTPPPSSLALEDNGVTCWGMFHE